MSINSKFCHSLMDPNCYIAMQFPQFSNTSNSHKIPYSQHFIMFSAFGVRYVNKSKMLICASAIAFGTFVAFFQRAATFV